MSYWGLDVSLTGTGVAEVQDDGTAYVTTISSPAAKGVAATVARMNSVVDALRDVIPPDALVMIESPAFASRFGNPHERAGLWWLICRSLDERGCLVTTASPNEIKKWATGKGNAPKDMVAMHVGRLWPDLNIDDNNQSDALAAAHMAAHRGGVPVPRRAHHSPANYAKIGWQWTVLTQPTALA